MVLVACFVDPLNCEKPLAAEFCQENDVNIYIYGT
jgi:hypothetical protein